MFSSIDSIACDTRVCLLDGTPWTVETFRSPESTVDDNPHGRYDCLDLRYCLLWRCSSKFSLERDLTWRIYFVWICIGGLHLVNLQAENREFKGNNWSSRKINFHCYSLQVLLAVGLTAAIVIGLTIFAFQTRFDFTVCGGALCIVLIIFSLGSIIGGLFFRSEFGSFLIACFGAGLFSIYIVYDTQLMMGTWKFRFENWIKFANEFLPF